jgi:alpha-1,3-mannosyltransferase
MRMRVLHVTPTYRPAIGGIETVIESLCAALEARGITAHVAHVAPGLVAGSEFVEGIEVKRIPLLGHSFLGLAPGLAPLVRGYDLIHAHDPQLLALTASLVVFAASKPAVLSTHGGFHHTRSFRRLKALHEKVALRPLLRRYRLVLASSKADFEWIAAYTDQVRLCENGVDVAHFASLRSAGERSPWNWLYWGRLSRNKRLDLVVGLARQARKLGVPVTLTLCGQDFDGTGEALRAASEAADDNWVVFEPPANDVRLAEIISRSGLYVTASDHEGFGLTVIEALATGLPVICRDMPPLDGFVDDTCGLRLAFDDSLADRRSVERFVAELPARHAALAAAGRARARGYDWSMAAERFLAAYREALE